ncbi:MAG: glycosyltransferase family 4 protein, partial [Bacilli bacterium]|nr:glycosyltransferase family 4 protein [Bacilli bacterium]
MRIGIFTEAYTPYISGLVTSEVMLKKALEKLGHTVYVVTANLESFHYDYDEDEHILRIPGIPTGIYDSRLTGLYPIKAVNIIKTWKLDIIHSQTEFAVGTFARLLAFQLDIPLVHTYHTMYEDYVHYVTKGYFDKSSKKIVEYLTRFYCDKTASELIVPTKKTYDLFKEKYKVDKNIHIIPTGIELERFYRENLNSERLKEFRKKYNLKEEDFIALFIGRIAQEKNIVYLIDVVKEVLPECPNLKMLIVGDGPDREEYQKLIEEYGLKEKIIMTGKTPWEDTPYHYHLADIFLTASTTETQGLTVIEAMASEITPICIEDESFANTVIDDLNGKLFKTKVGCKKAIIELYNDKEKNQKLAKQARINVEKYSAKYFAESVLNVYEYALAHKENRLGVFGKLVEKL